MRAPLTSSRFGSGRWLASALALLTLFLLANRELLSGDVAPIWDADSVFAPYFSLVADTARAGRLLLWNPWLNAGSPDFADPQVGAFSPVTVGFAALAGGTLPAFLAYWLFIWLGGGLGALILAKHLGAPPWGGLVAAAGFVFSGYFTGHAEHTSMLHAFATLPWVVWRLDCAMQSSQWRPAFEAGALWGLSGLGGYPAQTMINSAFALLWVIGRGFFPQDAEPRDIPWRVARHATGVLVVFFTVGVVILSPSYVSFLVESRGFSHRAEPLSRELAVGFNALHPGALASFASPYLPTLKLSNFDRLWSYTDVSSCSVYAGALVTWLAVFAVAHRPRDGWRWWLLGISALGIFLALGQVLPFRGWLYDLVPPTRYFRHAALFRGYPLLGSMALAALATRDLCARQLERELPWLKLAVTAFLASAAATLAYALATHGILHPRGTHLPFLARLHFGTVWMGTSAIVIVSGWAEFRLKTLATALVLLATADAILTQALSEPMLYTQQADTVLGWKRIDEKRVASLGVSWRRIPTSSEGIGLNNKNLPLKQPALTGYAPLTNLFHARWQDYPVLLNSAIGDRRVFFSAQTAQIEPLEAAFRNFLARSSALGAPPLVIHSTEALTGAATDARGILSEREKIAGLPAALMLPVAVQSYRPEELAFSVECPDDGWLLVTDRWARGWRATINGVPATVMGGNFIFRAVHVRAGRNEVRFTYHPWGIPGLLILSWTVLLGVAGSAVVAAWRRRLAA